MAYKEQNSRPFSVDAYNHFRITHPDRDLRPIIRRIHRLATSSHTSTSTPATEGQDIAVDSTIEPEYDEAHERELVRLDLQRWRSTIERVMGSVRNLEEQKVSFERDIQQTRAKTEASRILLEEEKVVLSKKRKERDEMVECDKVTKKIKARGKTRTELEEQIANLKQSIEHHKAVHDSYVSTAKDRASRFKEIIALVGEVKDIRLPDTTSIDDSVEKDNDAMEVDTPIEEKTADQTVGGGVNPRLNGAALPFQPQPSKPTRPSSSNHTNGTTSQPITRASTPGPSAPTGSTTSGRHNLPARPSRTASSKGPTTATSTTGSNSAQGRQHAAPGRGSNLRNVAGSSRGQGGGLEEGEVGGDEDGEVNDRRNQPKRGDDRTSRSRNQR